MNSLEPFPSLSPTVASSEQVFLVERDAGLLCRILGLYAARGLDVGHVQYAYAAQAVMKLGVTVACAPAEAAEMADTVRVLVAKAATLPGVLAAAVHDTAPRPQRAAAPAM